MIIDKRQNLARYKGINARMDKALDWMLSDGPEKLTGRVDIDGNEVYAMYQTPELGSIDEREWEAHFDYADIHMAVEGSEILGFANSMEGIAWPPRAEGSDTVLTDDGSVNPEICELRPGMCAILWPGEPHKPNTGAGRYAKIVVKIRMI